MTRYRWAGIMLAVLFSASPAAANGGDAVSIISCGAFTNHNTSYQYGSFTWLEYIVETRRDINLCPYAVSVEAWVVGHPGGSLSSSWDYFTASVRRPVLLPNYGTWMTAGKHWRILAGVDWYSNGSTTSIAIVRAPALNPEAQCAALGWDYYWNGYECVYTPGSPIIVDTAGDGYHLTSVDEGVLFDLDADGSPERTAWTRRDSDDAFLAMDRNGNGRIDDGSELFGNRTPVHGDRAVTTLNGFEALRLLQGPSYGRSTLDRQIDSGDAAFTRLLLWRDANHNGVSEPDELTPAGAALASISTDYREKKRIDRFGNQFRQQGRITWSTGDESVVYDVWLQRAK